MSEYLMDVTLPSNNKLNPEITGPLSLDMMGFEEEKLIFGSVSELAVDEVIHRCVKNFNLDVSTLTAQDRRFLLMKLRIHTYGPEYHVVYEENGAPVQQKISLEDLEIKTLGDDFTMPSGKLPMSGNGVVLQIPTVGQIRKIEDYCRDKAEKIGLDYGELRYGMLRAKRIHSVDGEELALSDAQEFMESLKGKDLAYIDYLYNQVDFGYARTMEITTKSGRRRVVPVNMTGEFFRPRFDD